MSIDFDIRLSNKVVVGTKGCRAYHAFAQVDR